MTAVEQPAAPDDLAPGGTRVIFSSPVDDIDQEAPVTTTFDPEGDDRPVGVTHESDAPAGGPLASNQPGSPAGLT